MACQEYTTMRDAMDQEIISEYGQTPLTPDQISQRESVLADRDRILTSHTATCPHC